MRSTIAVCNLPWITCVIPFREHYFDEALSGGKPGDDDVIEMM